MSLADRFSHDRPTSSPFPTPGHLYIAFFSCGICYNIIRYNGGPIYKYTLTCPHCTHSHNFTQDSEFQSDAPEANCTKESSEPDSSCIMTTFTLHRGCCFCENLEEHEDWVPQTECGKCFSLTSGPTATMLKWRVERWVSRFEDDWRVFERGGELGGGAEFGGGQWDVGKMELEG